YLNRSFFFGYIDNKLFLCQPWGYNLGMFYNITLVLKITCYHPIRPLTWVLCMLKAIYVNKCCVEVSCIFNHEAATTKCTKGHEGKEKKHKRRERRGPHLNFIDVPLIIHSSL
ncbi:MAG: hypothetical protein KAR43_10455, partial [Deltaproteobacteria bacterium]|nr:hypothetical protein [Deltaproteobacteria bacterium]